MTHIRKMQSSDLNAIVELSLLAWEPVFISFEKVLGSAIYRQIWPDWRTGQAKVVSDICQDTAKVTTYVADVDGVAVGFACVELNEETHAGEISLLAVHPDHQNHGIGTDLNRFAVDRMRDAGMTLAVVATGGDPGHAPARRAYEKAGFRPLPGVRYYQDLT